MQVDFIRKAAEDLAELVNDLLDLAKIEAGKIEVRPAEFDVAELFSALRGMLRPLLVSDTVALVFEPRRRPAAARTPTRARCRRSCATSSRTRSSSPSAARSASTARPADDGAAIAFAVADTGIGIAPEDHASDLRGVRRRSPSPLQARVKGTGLGLPLCRRLAALLGGTIALESTPGEGSTFTVTIPARYAGAAAAPAAVLEPAAAARRRPPWPPIARGSSRCCWSRTSPTPSSCSRSCCAARATPWCRRATCARRGRRWRASIRRRCCSTCCSATRRRGAGSAS